MAEQVHGQSGSEPSRAESAAPTTPAVSAFHIYKPGQGVHVRWATAGGAAALSVGLTQFVWTKLQLFAFLESNFVVRALIPVAVLVGMAYLIFWLVAQHPRVVDFLVATEGEMKKVNWSSKREVWGATKVVIVTVLALAFLLFIVDVAFILFFGAINVLKFDVFGKLLNQGQT